MVIAQRSSTCHSKALASLAKQKFTKILRDRGLTASIKPCNSAIYRCCLTEPELDTMHVQDYKQEFL